MNNKKNIIVIGGLGFIGHEVVRQLSADGHEVQVVDIKTSYNGAISSDELIFLNYERLSQLNGICTSPKTPAGQSIDCIIHCAGYPRQKVVAADPVNASASMNANLIKWLEYAKQKSVKRFVYISSSMVYGNFYHPATEEADCKPAGLYAILKYAGEQIVKDYAKRTGMEYVIIRPSAVYGPYDVADRVIGKFFTHAIANETLQVNGAGELLDLTYYTDTARGIVLAATVDIIAANQTFNITRGVGVSLLDAAQLVVDLVSGGTIEVRNKSADFPSRNALDISAARNLLGYNPTIDIEQGFKIYYDWLKDSFLRRIAAVQKS